MTNVTKIVIEKYNVSDIDYLVSDIYFKNGDLVKKNQIIATLESSKAAIDLESPCDGFIYHKFNKGSLISVGNIVAILVNEIVADVEELFEQLSKTNPLLLSKVETDLRISQRAQTLINQHGIDLVHFSGKAIVKESDVYEYMNNLSAEKEPDGLQTPELKENSLIIIGGMGGAKMCIDAIRSTNEYSIAGIVDPLLKRGTEVMGVVVLGGENRLQELYDVGFRKLVLSFSNLSNLASRRERCLELKNKGFHFPNIIHSRSVVEPSVKIGEGNLVLATSMIGSEVIIGNFNYINTGALICHEAVIGDNNHFAPNAVIAGRVKVANNTIIGMNVTTYFDIKIGSNVILNNGVNVFSDIADASIIKHVK